MGEEGALEGVEGVDGRPPAAGGVGKEALPHELAVRVAGPECPPDAKEVVEGEDRGGGKLEEDGEGGGAVAVLAARHARPEVVEDGDGKGTGGVEDDVGNGEVGGQAICPAEEEVREEGGGRVGMGSGPAEDIGAEEGECTNEGEGGARGGEVANVLDAGGVVGVGGEGEDEGSSGGDGGKEGVEEREVGRRDEDGEGEGGASGGEAVGDVVGEIEEGDEVTLGQEWDEEKVDGSS